MSLQQHEMMKAQTNMMWTKTSESSISYLGPLSV